MSDPIFGVLAKKWVAQCLHRYLPKNYTGVFKIYWKNVRKSVGVAKDIYPEGGDATIDPKEGEGIRFMFRYKEGKRHGLSVGFLPNGKLKSLYNYVNGKQHGYKFEFFPNGKLRLMKSMKQGTVSGLNCVWYRNGNIKKISIYEMKKPIGVCMIYDKSGHIEYIIDGGEEIYV